MALITRCRTCKSSKLHCYLDLGFHPHSDGFLTHEQINRKEVLYPLRVVICLDCGLHQLDYVVPKEDLYNEDYLYESSISQSGKKHYHTMAESICNKLNIPSGRLAIDIGSNVGVLLEGFKKMGLEICGIDPAPRIAAIANKMGIPTINDFFQDSVVDYINNTIGKATIITGTNVFAHIDDLDALMNGVKKLLTDDGFFIFELPHLIPMIENLEYDTIYHQHLTYVSIKPLIPFFDKFDMEIFDLESEEIHGGSMRIFVAEKGQMEIQPIVKNTLKEEEDRGMYSLDRLKEFADRVSQHRIDLLSLLLSLKNEGKKIVGIGAAAKGNTLLNYCGIHPGLLDFITEKSKLKVDRFSPGLHIPVVPDEMLFKDKPDYGLILPWNLANEIMGNLSEFKEAGGKFIIPIPQPKII